MSNCTLTDQLLNDRYKIIRPLGKGGMGQTYLAEDTRRPGSPQCVVKQLKPASTDPKFLVTAKRLFDNEAVILEKLGRTNDQIPQLLERFEKDGEFYLVQDFVDGEPLTSEMPLGQRWSETQVIRLLQEVLPILDAVHNTGIIHRDVKPDNLIRRQDGKLCLIDFGAVKQIRTYQPAHSQLISLTVAIGTPGYMPTEQSKGKPRPNSDLYALGMVAIQALTGMLPSQLREDDSGEVIWRDQAEVSEGLAEFLDKMTRYHFKERFETATEALQALYELLIDAKSTQTASNSQQSAKRPYQPTVEGEPARNNGSQKPDPSAQSEVWEEVEAEVPPNPKRDSVEEVFHKAASTPQQSTTKSPDATSKRDRLLLGIGAAIATVGLVAGAVFLQTRSQQEQALQTIEQSYAADKFDDCIEKAQVFPGFHTGLSEKAQERSKDCEIGKAQQSAFQEIQKLQDAKNYKEVISKAKAFAEPKTKFYEQAQTLLKEALQLFGDNQLAKAQELAKKEQFKNAIDQLIEITPEMPAYGASQGLASQWANKILGVAKDQYQSAVTDEDLQKAVNIAGAVPKDSSTSQEAQKLMSQWTQDWEKNKDDHWRARVALDKKQWQDALSYGNQLLSSPIATRHWRQVAQSIIERANKALLPILKTEGTLDKNSPRLSENNTLYQDHSFEGSADQVITITMESSEFDTRIFLINSSGKVIAWSDDGFRDGRDSTIRNFKLTEAGTYQVRANAFSSSGKGSYRLLVLNAQ